MLAVVINAVVIVLGTIIGLIGGNRFSKDLQEQVINMIGICVMFIGIATSLKGESLLIIVVSSILGVVIGHILKLEDRINGLGEKVKKLVVKDHEDSTFVTAFVTSSLFFCVGSMSILGAISAGLTQDYSILFTKSILDVVTAIILAASLGVGVVFSAVIVLFYEGAIAIFASYLQVFFTEHMISNISGVGGILIFALGINLMGIKELKTSNMLPAIVVAIVASLF